LWVFGGDWLGESR